MQYLGGKAKIAKKLSAALLDLSGFRHSYWEPFIGGASVFQYMAPEFCRSLGSDVHPDLILMWDALLGGWVPPENLSEEEWRELKAADPSPLRGFAGFSCSFGGKWFGGYARSGLRSSYAASGRRSLEKKIAKITSGTGSVGFQRASYAGITPEPCSVIYCDPPYAGTTPYSGTPAFDQDDFVITCKQWAADGCAVFVSEYEFPGELVWETERDVPLTGGRNMNGVQRRTERLFRVRP